MRPSHYLQLAAAALICNNVRLLLCAAVAAAYFLNRHIGAESTSVVLFKVDIVEMPSTQSQDNCLLTLLGSGCSVHSFSGENQLICCVLNLSEMLLNKP